MHKALRLRFALRCLHEEFLNRAKVLASVLWRDKLAHDRVGVRESAPVQTFRLSRRYKCLGTILVAEVHRGAVHGCLNEKCAPAGVECRHVVWDAYRRFGRR